MNVFFGIVMLIAGGLFSTFWWFGRAIVNVDGGGQSKDDQKQKLQFDAFVMAGIVVMFAGLVLIVYG